MTPRPGPTLSRDAARRVYDRIGARQDTQRFYEDPAVEILLEHGAFDTAQRVFELGCGTGRLAARLLAERLPPTARYRGVDLSPTMIGLARERVAPWADRAEVVLTDGAPPTAEPTTGYDRWISTYVLDLLSGADLAAMLREAHRMLSPGGLLCLASLGPGSGPVSRFVARTWTRIHRMRPALVGGCRPLAVADELPDTDWRIVHAARVAPFGVPSDVVVAERIGVGTVASAPPAAGDRAAPNTAGSSA
jgi:ubiquinone/menaquinone biosynthesis C-methylase UbiE